MKRKKMIEKLFKMSVQAVKKGNLDLINKAWSLCIEWNDKHQEEQEIFMAVSDNEYVAVEDDVVYFQAAQL